VREGRSPAAVCVIRIERQRSGMTITVMVNPDVRQTSEERLYRFGDIKPAVELVHDVIAAFRDGDSSP
jgi:hypothetical protein